MSFAMSGGCGLNPQAAEFIPRLWTKKASAEKDTDPSMGARGFPTPPRAVISYKSMLQSKVLASTAATTDRQHIGSVDNMVTPKKEIDVQRLLQSRRISTPKKSALNQHKDRWIELARNQSLILRNKEDNSDRSIQKLPAEMSSHWHSVLGTTVTNVTVTTQSLLLAEEAHRKQSQTGQIQNNISSLDASTQYSQWWTAVIEADYPSMAVLIDHHRVSWDCAFDKELCERAVGMKLDNLLQNVSGGASGETVAAQGLHALHVCAMLPNHALCLEQFVQRATVRMHLDSQERTHKRTALHYAAMTGNTEGVKILTSYGADVALKSRNGNTALHFATRANNLTIMSLLCEKSRKVVNIRNKSSETALMLAEGRSAVQILTNAGADLSSRNAEGLDALTLAARAANASLLDALLCCNVSHTTSRTPSVVNQSSNPLSQVPQHFTTPLHQVAQNGSTACLKLLLSRCCSCTSDEALVLHDSASSGRTANALHDCGMHVLDRPAFYTPLMQAGAAGHASVFAKLLLHGASPSKQTLNGCTALTLAVAAPHVSVAFLQEVLETLKSHNYPVEMLVTDNSLGWSFLACVALEALKVNKVASVYLDVGARRRSVLEKYVPKLALLIAHGAPIREDFLKLFADPVCCGIVHQLGVDVRSPLDAWQKRLTQVHLRHDLDGCTDPSARPSAIDRFNNDTIIDYCAEWVNALDPPQSQEEWTVPWGYQDVRVVLGSSERPQPEMLCHSFVLRTKRCGVLKSMIESDLARTEIIPEGEEGAGKMRVMLSFPHVQPEVFSVLLRWVYTGRDPFSTEFQRPDDQRRKDNWLSEWVEQRQHDAALVMELLYLSNELLMEDLQVLCEVHLCRLETALEKADVEHLVESIHCRVFSPYYALGDRRALDAAAAEMGAYTHMLDATVGSVEHINHLLFQVVEKVDRFCENHALLAPAVMEQLKRALRPTREVRRADAAARENASRDGVGKVVDNTSPVDSTVRSCMLRLMFALHCWLQRTSVQLSLTNHDVRLFACQVFDEENAPHTVLTAHRAILAKGSPKFAAMLRFVEAQGARWDRITLSLPEDSVNSSEVLCLRMDGMSRTAASALITFIYTQSLPREILCGESEDVDGVLLELVEVTDQHVLPQLTALLSRRLVQRLSADNALQYFDVARTHGLCSVASLSALFWLKQCSDLCCEEGSLAVASLVEEMLLFLLCPSYV